MIYVIATIQVHPGRREDFLAELQRNVPAVEAESGCLRYMPTVDVTADIGRPLPNRDDVVTIVEQWESVDALKAHFAMPHMVAYKERTKDMVVGVQLQVVEPV